MKKIIYFVPAFLACCIFLFILAYQRSFLGISTSHFICIALLFIAAVLMKDGKWWGCSFGLIAMDMEMGVYLESPAGFILFAFYILCGIDLYRKAKHT